MRYIWSLANEMIFVGKCNRQSWTRGDDVLSNEKKIDIKLKNYYEEKLFKKNHKVHKSREYVSGNI